MEQSLELIKITEKLQERCGCFDCEDGATMQRYMEQFLRVLARMFCWVDSECDTILKAQRTEILPVDKVELCACKAIMEVRPFYHKGFDPSTLKVYLHKRQGMKREQIELTQEQYDWSFVDKTILVDLTEFLSPCCKCDCVCECPTEYKIILSYEAGYTSENIPECVYDAMCHFLNIFIAYQNKCGSLDECANMDRLAVGSVLKQKSVDYIVREWVIDEASLDRVYFKLVQKWSFATLSSLSLCEKVVTDNMYIATGRREEC